MPIFSDSTSATTPRITGQRSARWRFAHETSGSEVTSISPSGLRTATAQVETPRIITPSSTAWPPTGASLVPTGRPSGIRTASTAVPSDPLTLNGESPGQRPARAWRRLNRSTRPPVSTSFCLPV